MGTRELKTRISVHFQYQGPADIKPGDWTQEEYLQFEAPAGTPITAIPIPAVGDVVSLTLTEPGRRPAYKVINRHFTYSESPLGLFMDIQIVVTGIAPLEAVELSPWVFDTSFVKSHRLACGLAASLAILLGVSASAMTGLVRERRHVQDLTAANQASSAAVRQLQADLQSVSDKLKPSPAPPPAAPPPAAPAVAKVSRPQIPARRERLSERNVYEFRFDRSSRFHRVGPVSLSVRQVDYRRKYCDLVVLAGDRQYVKKHVNLGEPVRVSQVELIVSQINNGEVRGYVSEPKSKKSELAIASVRGNTTVLQHR
jgi:hypothetical protein